MHKRDAATSSSRLNINYHTLENLYVQVNQLEITHYTSRPHILITNKLIETQKRALYIEPQEQLLIIS